MIISSDINVHQLILWTKIASCASFSIKVQLTGMMTTTATTITTNTFYALFQDNCVNRYQKQSDTATHTIISVQITVPISLLHLK